MTLLLTVSIGTSAQALKTNTGKPSIEEIRERLALDYTMPDYSTTKIDSMVMGPRLAKILEYILDNYRQHIYLGKLSMIQCSQVDSLRYGRVKTLKLANVTKKDNELTISFDTMLEPNALNLKKSQLIFHFVDGVSDDILTNEFMYSIMSYIKE